MSTPPTLSVIIPTLDEAARLPDLLRDLRPLEAEVIVVDGGSSDGTLERARQHGARGIAAPSGRGRQLAAGAAAAKGRWLFFVHADCRIDHEALQTLKGFLDTASENDFAHFAFSLDGDDFIHHFIEFGQRLRERWLGLVYGDQGLVVARRLYDEVGGYPDWPLMEDVGMIQRLAEHGRSVPLPATLLTSDRRYAEEGGLRCWLRNVTLLTLYRVGVSPYRLSRWYRPRRSMKGSLRTVAVFAKAPTPGRVKTRLAADIGDSEAAEIYRTMGKGTVDALRGGAHRLVVFGDPPDEGSLSTIAHWLGPDDVEVRPQSKGDLGARMAAAVEETLTVSDAVILVGTDIPGIDLETVDDAFARLARHDVVLGPATDGGYYLVGLTHPRPELFDNMAWSTDRVLPDTLERIARGGLSVALLEPKSDVDTVHDLTPAVRAQLSGKA